MSGMYLVKNLNFNVTHADLTLDYNEFTTIIIETHDKFSNDDIYEGYIGLFKK